MICFWFLIVILVAKIRISFLFRKTFGKKNHESFPFWKTFRNFAEK
jgi:hypothetical protein